MSSRARDLVKLSVVILVFFGLGLTAAAAFDLPRRGVAEPSVAAAPTPALPRNADGMPSFAEIVDRVNPSVVYIRTERHERPTARMRNVPPEFDDFFRRFNDPRQPRYSEGSGSGFIVTADGYILTNNHVVADAERVKVQLIDNRQFDARVVGRDPNTDVAVIKIDATGLPAMAFGNSEQVRIGDWVLAVGNPLGFTFTVTAGIVSAKGRALRGLVDQDARYTIQDFIQTDAAINPGNSGGPLIDLNGQVIGINSAIASQTGLYAGYGFAIPINLARRVMDDLIRTGRVDRAILGIGIAEITPEDAEYVGLRNIRGVRVDNFPDRSSPARSAGLQQGDIIVALNDTTVDHVAQLQTIVGFKRPGESVRVTVMRREGDRAGVRRTFDVRLVAAPSEEPVVRSTDSSGERDDVKVSPTEGRLGLRIQPLPPEYVRRAGLREEQQGVLVADVEEGGPAWGRVLAPEQGGPELILSVDQARVRTVEDFQRAVRGVRPGSVVQLQVINLANQGTQRVVRVRARR